MGGEGGVAAWGVDGRSGYLKNLVLMLGPSTLKMGDKSEIRG